MDDHELIRRVIAGDRDAFRPLVERYQGMVFGVAHGLVGDRADAEDLAQDAFVAAFRSLERYDRSQGFAVWIATIVRRKSLNLLKRASRTRRRTLPDHLTAPVEPPGPESAFFRALDAALAALPAAQRVAFVLAEIHELPHDAIAVVEGVPVGTIKSRVHRARKKLRSALEPTMEERT